MPSPNVFNLSGSKVNWEQMIEKIMKAYEKRLEVYRLDEWEVKQNLAAWKMLRSKLQDLRSQAKILYDPVRGPFNIMSSNSTNQNAFTATVDRNAKTGNFRIEVLQIAGTDIFQSDPIDINATIAAGTFTIAKGDKKYSINFNGGNITRLVDIINRVAGKIVNASIMNVSENNIVLVIEGKETGAKNKLYFDGDLKIFEKIGLFENRQDVFLKEDFADNNLFVNRTGVVTIKEGNLLLSPNSRTDRILSIDMRVESNYVMELECRVTKISEAISRAAGVPQVRQQAGTRENVRVGTIDEIHIGPYRITGQHMQGNLTDEQRRAIQNGQQSTVQTQQPQLFDNTIILLNMGNENIKKIGISDSPVWTKVSIPLTDIATKNFDRFTFINNNGNRLIEIRRLLIKDARESLKPKNHISKAQDAIIKYNGIKMSRNSNNLEKIIPGVTINVKSKTTNQETLTIDYDYEKVAKAVEDFIILYNNAMDYIYNITKISQRRELKARLEHMKKISELDEQRRKEMEKSGALFEGMLAGDTTVAMIKRKLRENLMSPYPTSAGHAIQFFIQVGLQNPTYSANASEEERQNMRAGYFEFKKEKFIEALKKDFQAVYQLFANDTDGDLIKDNGISVKLNESLQYIAADNYRSPNGKVYPGLIENRMTVAKNLIKNKQNVIKRFEGQMQLKRKALIAQIRRAEQAEQRAASIRQRLQTFSGGAGGGGG